MGENKIEILLKAIEEKGFYISTLSQNVKKFN